MTTDLVPKECAMQAQIGGRRLTVGGMAKGSGMIHPNLATMLGVLTTDAALEPELAQRALRAAATNTFNQVSVDRDTSTNDTLVLLASGAAGGEPIAPGTADAEAFGALLTAVCVDLARQIARDGEGASRMITARIEGASSDADARRIAREIVCSPLVKTAVYGRDPNWGRILAAIGNAGVPIDPTTIDLWIGDIQVASGGTRTNFDEGRVSDAMGAEEVLIRASLGGDSGRGEAWGCDLTEGYVRINAEYTT